MQIEAPEWIETTLGEAFTWGSGGTPTAGNASYYGGEIPWAIIGDLDDAPVRTTQKSITESGLRNSSAKWIEPGSILLAMYGSIGKLGITEIRMTTNQAIAFTKPEVCSPKYLYYYLLASRNDLAALGKGGTQQNISQTVIKAFPFRYPRDRDKQDEIVANLEAQFSRLDAGVAALKRAKANLKRYRASVLKAACEGRLVPTEAELARQEGRPYESGAQLLNRILEERRTSWSGKGKYKEPIGPDTTNLPELPEGWAWATIDQLADTSSGGTPRRGEPGLYGGDIPWVKSGELGDGCVAHAEEHITERALETSSAKVFPKGTLCIALYGATVGKLGVLGMDAATNQAVCGIFLPPELPTSFFFYYLMSIRRELVERGKGGAQPNISQEIIKTTPVPLPSIREQECIVAEVDHAMSVSDALQSKLHRGMQRGLRLRQATLSSSFGIR